MFLKTNSIFKNAEPFIINFYENLLQPPAVFCTFVFAMLAPYTTVITQAVIGPTIDNHPLFA